MVEVDTHTPARMRDWEDVNFFPLTQFDVQREAAERQVRSGGGTKPIGQERQFEPGTPAVFISDGVVGGSEGPLEPPVITNTLLTHNGTIGLSIPPFTIQASNRPTSRNATNLPAGLNVNTNTGVISGVPTAGVVTPGSHPVILTASNAAGPSEPRTLTLNLAAQPVPVVSAASVTHTYGTAWTHQISATNSPTSYAISGQPPGVTVNTSTGLISGTGAVSQGVHNITMHATNHGGPSLGAPLTVTIQEPFTPPPPVGWEMTHAFNGMQVTFQNDPTGRIPLPNWTGWHPDFAVDINDEALYTGPHAPQSPAQQVVRLFATFINQPEVEVNFDLFGPATALPELGGIREWGFDSSANAIYINGFNGTGEPIHLRLVREA